MGERKTNKFHKSGKTIDEYYTIYEEVKYIFQNIIDKDQLKNKIIYCPFDNDKSSFVKYLNEHKELEYKELWWTSDDYHNHEDLIEKADIIISNPPFSLLHKSILPMMKKFNKKFFLFGSIMMIYNYILYFSPECCKYIRRQNFPFITPFISYTTGKNETYVNGTIYMTNIELKKDYDEKITPSFFTNNDIDNIYLEDHLVIDKMKDYPKYIMSPVWCPLTAIEYRYSKFLEYLGQNTYYRRNDKSIYSDGKSRFIRVLMKRKK